MYLASILFSILSLLPMLVGSTNMSSMQQQAASKERDSNYLKKLKCKPGSKAGKTPISLIDGDAVSCYKVALANKGKLLLTKDTSNTCVACHSSAGIAPASNMIGNLRAQGYTLEPASISSAFAAHQDEMAGSFMSKTQAKFISNYLQSLK